jgi:hypothetical protein
MVGTQIGNYRILVNLDRVVAIKALNTELRGNAGGIFGHKRGAATGAVAGAGAGTGAQYMSNAEPVTIPSENRIDFTLRTPVTLTP